MSDHDPTASKNTEWKEIQERTFTRWCNEQLKVKEEAIHDLKTDFCDGIKLIQLLKILTGKKVGKCNKRFLYKSRKLDNARVALDFIRNETNQKLANIGKLALYNFGIFRGTVARIHTKIINICIVGFHLISPLKQTVSLDIDDHLLQLSMTKYNSYCQNFLPENPRQINGQHKIQDSVQSRFRCNCFKFYTFFKILSECQ